MEVRNALFLVLMVYITLSRAHWIIASDMEPYHTWSTVGWLIAGMSAFTVLVIRSDASR